MANPLSRRLFVAFAWTLLMGAAPGAGAQTLDDAEAQLYRTQTIVTGQDPLRHGAGLIECFTRALVKAAGDPRLADDEAAAHLSEHAADYVARITLHDRLAGRQIHDEQGSRDRPFDLIVEFDKTRLDKALRLLGRQPWPTPRPPLAIFVSVHLNDAHFVLSADGGHGAGMSDALAAAADRFGMKVVLPPEMALQIENLRAGRIESGLAPAFDAMARVGDGALPVAGILIWDDAKHGWTAQWQFHTQRQLYRWTISGVNFDAAFRSAVGGAAQILSGNGAPR